MYADTCFAILPISGLKVSWNKTKVQDHRGPSWRSYPIRTCCGHRNHIELYISSSVVSDPKLLDQEVSKRIGRAANAMKSIDKSIRRRQYIYKRTTLCVFKVLIMPVLFYKSDNRM